MIDLRLLLSILPLLYFGFLILNTEFFRFQSIASGIIQELFIPFIVGQFILLYFAWKKFKALKVLHFSD